MKCWWVSWQIEQGRPLLWSLPFRDFSASFDQNDAGRIHAGAGVMAHRRQALPVGQHVSTRSPPPPPPGAGGDKPGPGRGCVGEAGSAGQGAAAPGLSLGQVCAWDRTVSVGAGLRGSRSGVGGGPWRVGSMTALQLKELLQSGLYRRRRDRPDSLRLPGPREEALR